MKKNTDITELVLGIAMVIGFIWDSTNIILIAGMTLISNAIQKKKE